MNITTQRNKNGKLVWILLNALFITGIAWTQNASGGKVLSDIPYAKVGDKSLLLDVYQPAIRTGEKAPCVVWIHGGGWYSGSKEKPPILPLVSGGYVLVSINYRLTGEAGFPAQIYDCKAAIRWVRANAATYNIDPNRIGVVGFSAGGHLAALIGTSGDVPELEGSEGSLGVSSQVQAVVDGYGPSDFKSMWQEISNHPSLAGPGKMNNVEAVRALLKTNSEEEREKMTTSASPLHYVRSGLPPFYIFQGTEDKTVPPQQSQVLYDALKSHGNDATLEMMPGKGHGVQGPEVGRRVAAFLDEKLKNKSMTSLSSQTPGSTSTETPSALPAAATSMAPVQNNVLRLASLSKKPAGIYALFPPDRAGQPAPNPSTAKIWGSRGMDGIALRTFWDKVEFSENHRNWSHFDEGVKSARQNHKSVSLSIASGIFSPPWIFDVGAAKFQVTAKSNYGSTKTRDIPPPWDAVYLEKWGSLIREMGKRYDGVSEVGYVVIGGMGTVVETYFAKEPDDLNRFNKLGGSAVWLEGAKKVVDLFAQSFPMTPVILAMGEPTPGPEGKKLLQDLVEYGLKTYPGHFGLMHHGLTAISGKEYYPNAVIADNSLSSPVGFQMVWSTQGNGAEMIHGTLETALQHGVALKAHFIEVYGEDILSNRYGAVLESVSLQLKKNGNGS